MDKKVCDFSGWATKADIKCSDGRIIKDDAFKDQDGVSVPLVWQHNHTEMKDVLGHALLENRRGGVYCYCTFNNTESGQAAKELVRNGDIGSLSIFANKLKQNGSEVVHGAIKEVSLVLAGANPGALIDNIIAHGETDESSAEIYTAGDQEFELDVEIEHSEEEPIVENEEMDPVTENNETEEVIEHAEGKTIQEVVDSMNEEQRNVLYYMVGKVAGVEDDVSEDEEEAKHEDNMEDNIMNNAFENQNNVAKKNVLSHDELNQMLRNAISKGTSLQNDFAEKGIIITTDELAHSASYGVENIGNLFPEVKAINNTPFLYKRRTEWVDKVMSRVHHTPFSRVKSTYADITADEARAKGYIKGNQKAAEVIAAFKRTTSPTTVYKLQKLDRDDIIDITDFDIVPWIKAEMRIMLDEELARAILIGDGRTSDSNDKINPQYIRPILGDNEVYTIKRVLTRTAGDNEYTFAKDFIRQVIKGKKGYKGSGKADLFTTEDLLTDMLLIEDTNGHRLYKNAAEVALALGVNEVIDVPVFEGVYREGTGADAGYNFNLLALYVNLTDYNIGADKGGSVNLFDDFDINYNRYEYLIETRCSGALVTPYSAISFEEKVAAEVAEG